MGLFRSPASVRTHLFAIVLFGAIVPLTLVGFLLTRSAARSGERLLEQQVLNSLNSLARSITSRWEYRRGDLLLLAENESARSILAAGRLTPADSQYLVRLSAAVEQEIPAFAYLDTAGGIVYATAEEEATADRTGPSSSDDGGGRMTVRYPVPGVNGGRLGELVAEVRVDGVVSPEAHHQLPPGSAMAVRDRAGGVVLHPLAPGLSFPDTTVISIGDEPWMARSLSIDDPPFDVAVAAPRTPYVAPFERAGRIGLALVVVVALVALALSALLTMPLVRAVGDLMDAAGGVAEGDLSRRASPSGPAELHRLAGSFNTMAESLRRLLAELSERRALAAVGEFATSLSHEVRNALTSIQIDLERVDERSEDAKNQRMIGRTLAHVRRLDAAVSGALRVARSGMTEPKDVDLGEVLRTVVLIARPNYEAAGATIELNGAPEPLVVKGDAGALRQMFLNLVLNARDWLPACGRTTISVGSQDGRAVVYIVDTGPGMSAEQRNRAFDPYFTTRPDGTGLGLPIARQIAVAHGGEVDLTSTPGSGTTVAVTLPVKSGSDPADDLRDARLRCRPGDADAGHR